MAINAMRSTIGLLVLCTVPASPLAAQTALVDRPVQTERNIYVPRPIGPATKGLVEQVCSIARVPVGFEAAVPDKLPPRVVPAPPREDSKQLITGKRAGDAFQAIVDADRRYVWQDRHSVIQFYPVNQFNDPGAPLNRTIKEFVVEHGTLQDALTDVRRLFNPAFQPSGVMQSGFSLSEAAEAEGKEVFSVNVHNATLRDVLNAIVTAHGAAMWFVAYRDSPATLQNMTLELRTFGGWALATGF